MHFLNRYHLYIHTFTAKPNTRCKSNITQATKRSSNVYSRPGTSNKVTTDSYFRIVESTQPCEYIRYIYLSILIVG